MKPERALRRTQYASTGVNVNGANGTRTPREGNQAVVLTLRKRNSFARRVPKHLSTSFAMTSDSSAAGPPGGQADAPLVNPWEDSHSRTARLSQGSASQNHRLSFDHATGVIMLPDDGDWLIEDSDSDRLEHWLLLHDPVEARPLRDVES